MADGAARYCITVAAGALVASLAWLSPVPACGQVTRPATTQVVPAAPAGWAVREVVRMAEQGVVRVTSDRRGRLYGLSLNGDVWLVELAGGKLTPVLRGKEYAGENAQVMGFCVDAKDRMYLVVNKADHEAKPAANRVTIFRTTSLQNGLPAAPARWFETTYPYGVDTFNHGVSKVELGPDSFVYVSSGSRTDHAEVGAEENRSTTGEVPLTACIWRMDPEAAKPTVEIWAEGIRNAFGFCWDGDGRMWATENGPNADAPEELNRVECGRHYGFPYRFGDLTKKVYADQPEAPAGLEMTGPVINEGPAGGGTKEKPKGTFDDHSSPGGVAWLGTVFPEKDRGTLLVGRFGNIIGKEPVGFDVLQMRVREEGGQLRAETKTFMEKVGRVTDLCVVGNKVYVCIMDEQVRNGEVGGEGKILEVTPK